MQLNFLKVSECTSFRSCIEKRDLEEKVRSLALLDNHMVAYTYAPIYCKWRSRCHHIFSYASSLLSCFLICRPLNKNYKLDNLQK